MTPSSLRASPEDCVAYREELRLRLGAVRAAVSADDYRMFVLAYVFGYTSKEVGRCLGRSAASIDDALSKVRRLLRRHEIRVRLRC